jgi:hypothetical protein
MTTRRNTDVLEQTGDAILALIAEHKRLWSLETEEANAAAGALCDRLREAKPTTLASAIAQLEFAAEHDDPDMAKTVAAGLRDISGQHAGDDQIAELRARAEAMAAEYDAPLPEGDAGLVEADRRFQELRRRSDALYEVIAIDDAQTEEEIIKGIIDPVRNRLWDFIEQTPPVGPPGAAVKLRLLTDPGIGLSADETSEGEATCLQQVAEFVERQVGPGAAVRTSAEKAQRSDPLAAAISEALALRLLSRYRDARGAVEDYGGAVSALPDAPSFAEIEERYTNLVRQEVLG